MDQYYSTWFGSRDVCHSVRTELRAALIALLGVLFRINMDFSRFLCLCDITILLFSCLFMLRPLESLVICFCISTDQHIPLGVYDNLPVSISLLAKHGSDEFLLNLVETLYDTLKEEVDIVEKMGYWILSLPNILLFILYPTQRYKIRRKEKLLLAILCHIGSFFLKHLILQVALKCN